MWLAQPSCVGKNVTEGLVPIEDIPEVHPDLQKKLRAQGISSYFPGAPALGRWTGDRGRVPSRACSEPCRASLSSCQHRQPLYTSSVMCGLGLSAFSLFDTPGGPGADPEGEPSLEVTDREDAISGLRACANPGCPCTDMTCIFPFPVQCRLQ